MKYGVVFPQTEIGNDPGAIRDYIQTVEGLGYNHIVAYDHVLGANPKRDTPLKGPYTHLDPFHEVFVLYSFMSAITERIEFTTGILILPQRETALVAKQAATLDVLSGGRLRLGVGIGWNWVEYEALNQEFRTRGKRVEEQVELLRRLWTAPLVTFKGKWHDFSDAGLNPMPIQQPIPVWFGGHADAVLKRVAFHGDGWMPNNPKAADVRESLEKIDNYLKEVGRSWDDVGLEPRLWHGDGSTLKWERYIEEWLEVSATHLSFNTMRCGFRTAAEHISAVRAFAETTGL
jgi:probable F420-dependent oxidoreductase